MIFKLKFFKFNFACRRILFLDSRLRGDDGGGLSPRFL